MVYSKQEGKEMKKLMIMEVACLMAAITFAADADADALKAVLEKVADAETQCRIGNCYAEGKVVAKDTAEAVRWYRKAAAQGSKLAGDMVRELMKKKSGNERGRQ